MWSPSPYTLVCNGKAVCKLNKVYYNFLKAASADCVDLTRHSDIFTIFRMATSGNNGIYQCRHGQPGVHTTQCTSNGLWSPDPILTCREAGITFSSFSYYPSYIIILPTLVMCQKPSNSTTGTEYKIKKEGSRLLIYCRKGYSLTNTSEENVTSVCTNGTWLPNPIEFDCISNQLQG